MPTKLSLVNNAVRATKSKSRIPSPRQQQVIANMSLISRTWRTLTEQQREGFNSFAIKWSPNGKKRNSGLTVFQSLNGVRLSSGYSDLIVNAPQVPDFVGSIPALSIAAQSPALSLTGTTPPTFSLTIDTDETFSFNVQVYATRPLSPGQMKPAQREFVQIATLTPLLPTTNIASFYTDIFPAPIPGTKVALQFVPHTDAGFRGTPVTHIVTVGVAP